jgi:hypothetical protein
MNASATMERLEGLRGYSAYDIDGRKIGHLEEIFYGLRTGRPEWLGIASGFLGTTLVVVPVAGVRMGRGALTVGYRRDVVVSAPELAEDDLDEPTSLRLARHYGLHPVSSARGAASGIPGHARRA